MKPIIILDFGSQFTQLIARRIRELGVFAEILSFSTSLEKIRKSQPLGIILSGGPSSVFEKGAPVRSDLEQLMDMAPVLGICYGMQLLAHNLGGKVTPGTHREYGSTLIKWDDGKKSKVWMSHGDLVEKLPTGAKLVAQSEAGIPAVIKGEVFGQKYWGLQFHPEVSHTEGGTEILKEFVFDVCKAQVNWDASHKVEYLKERIRAGVGGGKVLVGLSGGVDSTVTAKLLVESLGVEKIKCIFVDTGLLRLNEREFVLKKYQEMNLPVKCVDASEKFLRELKDIVEPEAKRKVIGRVFIEIFEEESKKIGSVDFLAQGTLYPDVIESVNIHGQSVTIKSHHNVGGLPEKMKLALVEPLRELFKDEVRLIGKSLGVSAEMLGRHPFPGPGLGIRIMGDVNNEDLDLLRRADDVFIRELREHDLYDKIWQAFAVLLPVRTVGVMGDGRTYDKVLALRAVTSLDGMTADWFKFDHDFLAAVSNKITNQVKGINRVVYDISSKPPATIEWE